MNTCVITNESLNPVLYAKGDPTNKSVHTFTFRFFPFQSIDGVVQAHVRPLDGAVMENTGLLSSTNTHLVMGFNIPSGFSVWIGHPNIVGILDGCLLDCDIMFMLESGWTHMKVIRFFEHRKHGLYDYRVRHVGKNLVQDICFQPRKYGHGADAKLSTWCLLRSES